VFEDYILDEDGLLAWRRGTGDNVEITYLRVYEQGQGCGRRLLGKMVDRLRERPPYATVFGFTRTSNTGAQVFYEKMGFTLSPVRGVYADGSAVVFSANYADLLERHCGEKNV
jgi:ribosomal protein S18 acetylase RimI-like enzyme